MVAHHNSVVSLTSRDNIGCPWLISELVMKKYVMQCDPPSD